MTNHQVRSLAADDWARSVEVPGLTGPNHDDATDEVMARDVTG
jgi:hypothetical protein